MVQISSRVAFEPAGEECGTRYDDSSACTHIFAPQREIEVAGRSVLIPQSTCGVGAQQIGRLHLDGRRIPKRFDFCATIAGEVVVSKLAKEVFEHHGLSGFRLDPIRLSDRGQQSSEQHYQLRVVGARVDIHGSTRAGEGPFDNTGYGRCPHSHIWGLNLLSEVTVTAETLSDADVVATRQQIGVRRGLLRPRPVLLLSPRAWLVVRAAKLRGLRAQRAHVVE